MGKVGMCLCVTVVVGVMGGRYTVNAGLHLIVAASRYEIRGRGRLDGGESGRQRAD